MISEVSARPRARVDPRSRLALAVALSVPCARLERVPPPADPDAPAPAQRCHEGSDPIEILAADVVIAIDRSASTRNPTGIDLDGDGVIGEFRRSTYTDRDDSVLAAQLARWSG